MEKSKFDTNFTLKYKYAKKLGVPVKYVLYKDEKYISLLTFIETRLQEESVVSVLEEVQPFLVNVTFREFIMIYYYIASQYDLDPKDILKSINDLIEQINIADENTFGSYSRNNEELDRYEATELSEDFKQWKKSYIQELAIDKEKLQKILTSQKILEETEPKPFTNPIIEELKLEFKPKLLDGSSINFEDAVGIFNDMIPSINVPYIQYNDSNGKKYYKVYEDINLNFENIIPSFGDTRKDNHIYFRVSILEDIKDIVDKENAKKNYITCKYDFTKNRNTLTVRGVPEKHKNIILSRLFETFQNLDLGPYREVDLKGDFTIPNVIFDFPVLHFLVFNDENEDLNLNSVFSSYIFIDETKSSTANRDILNIKFKTLDEEKEDDEDEEKPEEYSAYEGYNVPSSLTLNVSKKENYYNFRLTKVKNYDILKEFLEIFTRLVTIYESYREDVYSQLFLKVLPELEELKTNVLIQEVGKDKLSNLRKADPDIFQKDSNGYARLCSCERQPLIVDDDEEAEDWSNKTLEDGKKREIGNFPPRPEDLKVRYVCPDDDYPYPGLIKANVNVEEYPYIPCCAKNYSSKEKLIEDYYSEQKKSTNKSYKINTIKVLDWKRDGNIPLPIQNLLASFSADEKYEFGRIGTGRSTNSFIHAVMIALGQTTEDSTLYENLENYEQREIYCQSIREKLLNFSDLAIYSQETFDMEPLEIERLLKDQKIFLDPALFYRGIEELYDINIFVFKPEENDQKREPSIEIPRHKFCHIRQERLERRSVIILKHNGGDSEDLKYPQCELIINTGKIKDKEEEEIIKEEKKGRGRPKKEEKESKLIFESPQYDFGEDITRILFNSLEKYNKNYVFDFGENGNIKDLKIQTRLNPFSKVRYEEIFSNPIKIISQGIDNYGKARSFNFKIAQYELTAFVPPTQPLDVPLSKNGLIYIAKPKVVETIFGTPKKIIKEGYWYSIIDFEYGMFVPCETGSENLYPETPVHYNQRNDIIENPITKYRDMKKYFDIFMDLVIWGLRSNKVLNLKDFDNIPRYIQIVKSLDYNILPVNLLDYRLPEKQNFTYLYTIWPNYFTNNNKVKMTQTLYDKVMVYLKRYYIETDGLSLPPPKYLQGIFEYEWDFAQYINSRVIINQEKLDNWRKQRRQGISSEVQIYREIVKESLYKQEEPYLYLDEEKNRLYLIQNVRGGSKNKALFVAQNWNVEKFNLGFNISDNAIADFDNKIETIIYILDSSGKLVPKAQENITIQTTKYAQIYYNNATYNYSAMLPLI
jgi:hypothetical protein